MTAHFQDDGYDVISRRKVLPPGEWKRSVCEAPIQQRTPVPDLSCIRNCLYTIYFDACWFLLQYLVLHYSA